MVMRDKNLNCSNIISLKTFIHHFFIQKFGSALSGIGNVEKNMMLVQNVSKRGFSSYCSRHSMCAYTLQIPLKLREDRYKLKSVCNSHGILVPESAR